jgi:hypothetical protein
MTWGGRKVARLKRAVLQAYGPVCALDGPYCRETGSRSIDLSLRFPHRGSFSIDHRLARSRGGGDDIALLRPAHLACNSSRGDGRRAVGEPRVVEDGRAFFEPEGRKPRSPFPFPPEPPEKTGDRPENARETR